MVHSLSQEGQSHEAQRRNRQSRRYRHRWQHHPCLYADEGSRQPGQRTKDVAAVFVGADSTLDPNTLLLALHWKGDVVEVTIEHDGEVPTGKRPNVALPIKVSEIEAMEQNKFSY